MKIKTSTKNTSTDFEVVHIKEDIYTAELTEVKEISDGQFGHRVAFIYKIVDKVEKPVELALVCYLPKDAATENNRFGQVLIAHGVELKDDQEVETDALVGTKVRAWVEDFDKEIEKDGKKEKVKSSAISKVKPLE